MSDYPKHYREEEAYFSYVDEVDQSTYDELLNAARSAISVFHIPQTDDGKEIASAINKIVDDILATGEFPREYYDNDINNVAVELGALYGFALNMGYGWRWKKVGKSADELTFSWGVGPEDDNWFTPCGVYLAKILTGKNINRDGENDNTVLLNYNMIPGTLKTTPARKLTILW